MQTIKVTCAIIVKGAEVLAAKRPLNKPQGGLWEFPGGKVNGIEDLNNCIKREIMEELGVNIQVSSSLAPVVYQYPQQRIELIPFVATIDTGNVVTPLYHIEIGWFSHDELLLLDWCPADVPVLHQFLSL